MADENKKKSFWEILAIVITAIAAVLGGLNGVAALITAMNSGKEGATKTESVPPTQTAPTAQPPSVPSINDEAVRRFKAEAEIAKAEAERAKTETAEAEVRAAELERKLAEAERKVAIEMVKAKKQAAVVEDANKEVEIMKDKMKAAEKELAESTNSSNQKNISILNINNEAARKFLNENRVKNGVKTTASGLQYKVLRKGDGPKPNETDTVKVHYRGTLLDGTEFDSSYKRNEPAKFRLNQVIPGWIEALQLMPVGSIFELYLPPDLAYGDKGASPVIQPGSLLKFEIELLDIVGE